VDGILWIGSKRSLIVLRVAQTERIERVRLSRLTIHGVTFSKGILHAEWPVGNRKSGVATRLLEETFNVMVALVRPVT
jgi:hypothetical protein